MAGANPNYDLQGALEILLPGVVMQRAVLDAGAAAYAAKNYQPLDATDVPGILAAAGVTLPSYPAGLPRFPDSNASPRDGWVKYGAELIYG
jgi:hypothetical protein